MTYKDLQLVAHWIPVDPDSDIEFKCSRCASVVSTAWDYDNEDMFRYCPCCGARMVGDENG